MIRRAAALISVVTGYWILSGGMNCGIVIAEDAGPSGAVPSGSIATVGNTMTVTGETYTANQKLIIPRVFGSIVNAYWASDENAKVEVHPEPNFWELRWKELPATGTDGGIVLTFDQSEDVFTNNDPISTQSGDGSVMLRADQGHTSGEKLRYEPQPHKNTIGYWTVPTDQVHWKFVIDESATFNVGLLAGCGEGQGGSIATVTIDQQEKTISSLEFEVAETGHFQNFRWINAGVIQIAEPGEYRLTIRPKQLANKALMDVRRVHLSIAR